MGTSPNYEAFEYLKTGTFPKDVQRLATLSDRKKVIEEEMVDIRMSLGIALDTVKVKSVLWKGRPVTLIERKGGRTLDKEQLKLELVERGVPVETVMDSIYAATTIGKPSTTVSLGSRK
jgi:hypothetical protein